MFRKTLFSIAMLSLFASLAGAQLPMPAPAPNAPAKHDAPKAPPQNALPAPVPADDVLIVVPGDDIKTPAPRSQAGVGGVSIYGMTDAAAVALLQQRLAPQLGVAVRVNDGRKTWLVSRAALGAQIPYKKLFDTARATRRNVALRFELDDTKARETLRNLAERIVANDEMRVEVSIEASLMRARAALEAQPPRDAFDLVLVRSARAKPNAPTDVSSDDAPDARFPFLLAQFATHYDAGIRGRTHNLKIAAHNVNNTIVQAGGVFSANGAIGPRNAADGWREAKMFVDGQIVSGIGSGICQCSSTIYNAALLAGFPIVERHPHMFRVSYVPVSRDAAIYWKQKDMRFRNTSSGPILVQTYLGGGKFHAKLWGIEPTRAKVEVSSEVLSRRGGTRAASYRVISDENGTRRERLSRDFYRPHP